MEICESIEDFYKRKYDWIPDSLKKEIGHFNVFAHVPIEADKVKPLPYKRRDFYKIMYVKGPIEMQYADKVVKIKKQALFFSNPQIPYRCNDLEKIQEGYYCIFNDNFFLNFGELNKYSVFQPNGTHVFELSDVHAELIKSVFLKMFDELNSEYEFKYDMLRNQVFELLHFALKLKPETHQEKQQINAAHRISTLLLELIERQFPIDENHPSITLRSPADFANQLNVHVNHLNRAVKSTCQKTSSQIIAERILQEAKTMLKHSKWNVSEVAYALGFVEVTHFNNFFKKHTGLSPSKFRNEF